LTNAAASRASSARRQLSEGKIAMKFVILHKAPKQDNNLMWFCRCYVSLNGPDSALPEGCWQEKDRHKNLFLDHLLFFPK
jgi:hypothetical protein